MSVPIDRLIWLSATWPKITARMEPSQKTHTMPSTSEAIARPLVRARGTRRIGADGGRWRRRPRPVSGAAVVAAGVAAARGAAA